jgi:CHAD domain-containing protein
MPKNVRALGAAALAPGELNFVSPGAHSSTADVIRYSLAASVEMLLRSDAPLRLNMDPETVHQARVATRKLRSDLRTFKTLLGDTWASALRRKIKWLSKEFGRVRDADVLLSRLRQRAAQLAEQDAHAAEAVIQTFVQECETARRSLAQLLKQQRYVALLDELVHAAAEPRVEQLAGEPAIDVLPRLVEKPWRKLNKAVLELGDDPDDDRLHQVRIKAKHCRYAAEAVIPVIGKPAEKFARKVQRLQKILGELHDAGVLGQRLHKIDGAREEIFIAGELAAMEARAAGKARASWRKAWEKASKKSMRSWMG